MSPPFAEVSAVLHRLFIGREGTSLRKEDVQKAHELTAMLRELGRLRRGATLVDAAAGKSSVGLMAAELLEVSSLVVLERDPRRIEACRAAATKLTRAVSVDVREADVDDDEAWPRAPDAVVALHACGRASDRVLDQAIRVDARFLFLVPCCYGADIPFMSRALEIADRMGIASYPAVRRRIAAGVVDAERTLRLESAGWETETFDFVGATITPHNLLLRARRTRSASRMQAATARLAALRAS